MFNFVHKNTEKEDFPTKLFVISSLLSLFLLGGVLVVVASKVSSVVPEPENNQKVESKISTTTVSSVKDPFITKVPQLENVLQSPITDGRDPQLGSKGAEVTIVEFADYKCGVCQEQISVLKKIKDEYGKKVRVIWKDYPFYQESSPSFQAARAARCAGEQDEFWDYNKLLYQNNEQHLNDSLFISLAKKAGLNIYDFRGCLQGKRVNDLIMDNIIEANALSIKGVPFIYINDQEIMGEASYKEIERLIEIEMKDQ